jgi:O-antigen/teichoic acid export membrane protein
MKSLASGFGWNAVSQAVSAITALVVIPVIVGRVGISQYGLFTLASASVGFLQQIDGGMLNAALRYFGIASGRDDRTGLTSHFLSIAGLVLVISCPVAGALAIFAGPLSSLFHLGPHLAQDGTLAARVVAAAVPVGLLQGVLVAVLQADGAFKTVAWCNITVRVAYATAVIVDVHGSHGLRVLIWLIFAQQLLLALTVVPSVISRIQLRGARLLTWRETKPILAYSTRVQAFTVSSIINLQADALIVGAVLPLRDVAWYGTGALLATQLRAIPMNAAGPLVTRLARTYGRSGSSETFDIFARIQEIWTTLTSCFMALAVGASMFVVEAWLGPRFAPAGLVCAILTAGNLINLLTAPLTIYLQVIGRPDVELRYGAIGAVVNVLFTLAFVWVGLYGIVGATAAAQAVGSLLLVRISRARVSRVIPSFLKQIPTKACLTVGLVAGGLDFVVVQVLASRGVVGLAAITASSLVAALTAMVAVLGVKVSADAIIDVIRTRSPYPVLHALVAVHHSGSATV